jgi:hypothetical protein
MHGGVTGLRIWTRDDGARFLLLSIGLGMGA